MWIPISREVPPPCERVLLSIKVFGWHGERTNYITVGHYNGDSNILAWMPLPKPYNENQDNSLQEAYDNGMAILREHGYTIDHYSGELYKTKETT